MHRHLRAKTINNFLQGVSNRTHISKKTRCTSWFLPNSVYAMDHLARRLCFSTFKF